MKASIEARRKALAGIEKPKLEDYLLHCDRQTLNLVASFQRAMVGDLVTKTLAAARACNVATLVRHRRRGREQRIAPALRAGRGHGRPARVFPFASTLDRQRSHDRSRGLSQISGQRICRDGFFCGSGDGAGLGQQLAIGNWYLEITKLSYGVIRSSWQVSVANGQVLIAASTSLQLWPCDPASQQSLERLCELRFDINVFEDGEVGPVLLGVEPAILAGHDHDRDSGGFGLGLEAVMSSVPVILGICISVMMMSG